MHSDVDLEIFAEMFRTKEDTRAFFREMEKWCPPDVVEDRRLELFVIATNRRA